MNIPLLSRVVWHFLDYSFDMQLMVFKLQLLLWPASIMMLAAANPQMETGIFLFSMAANVVFYAFLGTLVWLGLRKHGAFFAIAGIGWGVIWWKLLSL
ncbi:hypothetical protein [Janthinobacterium sp.]|uniref:hypothetical protein n=1 Tax=Janthinobacterium sp. TaxID=1871054 RepID=UPI00258C2269|nr:hypothetical protein [Janthinobacterium sp.]MCX7293177.1 hypothetical protein [Janthinobacterium sp.]